MGDHTDPARDCQANVRLALRELDERGEDWERVVRYRLGLAADAANRLLTPAGDEPANVDRAQLATLAQSRRAVALDDATIDRVAAEVVKRIADANDAGGLFDDLGAALLNSTVWAVLSDLRDGGPGDE